MTWLLEIFKFCLKIVDKETLKSITKIPKSLQVALGSIILIGGIYFLFSSHYVNEINNLHTEVYELQEIICAQVSGLEYSRDLFYVIKALSLCEYFNKIMYEENQLLVELLIKYIKRTNSVNDPILVDLEAMHSRNAFYFKQYREEVEKIISNIKNKPKNMDDYNFKMQDKNLDK